MAEPPITPSTELEPSSNEIFIKDTLEDLASTLAYLKEASSLDEYKKHQLYLQQTTEHLMHASSDCRTERFMLLVQVIQLKNKNKPITLSCSTQTSEPKAPAVSPRTTNSTGAIKKTLSAPTPAASSHQRPKNKKAIKQPSTAASPAETTLSQSLPALPTLPLSNQFDILSQPPLSPIADLPDNSSDELMEDDDSNFTPVPTSKKRSRAQARSSSDTENHPPSKIAATAAPSSNDSFSSDESEEETSKHPPPIILREKSNWPRVKRHCTDHSLNVLRAVNSSDTIKIYLSSVEEYRSLTSFLKTKEIPYNCFQLPEDKKLHVVIRGVLESTPDEDIRQILLNRKLPVTGIHRMKRGDRIWPLVAVQLERTEYAQTIFDLKSIDGIQVRVEPRRKSPEISQCRRCLVYRHTAQYCNAKWRCAFCAGSHPSFECRKATLKDATPTCFHCGGEHRATYRGCPQAPARKPNPPTTASSSKAAPSKTTAPALQSFPPLRGKQPQPVPQTLSGYSAALKSSNSSSFMEALRPQFEAFVQKAFSEFCNSLTV